MKRGLSEDKPRFFAMRADYSAGAMAPIGQASAQVPQSMQMFGSIV